MTGALRHERVGVVEDVGASCGRWLPPMRCGRRRRRRVLRYPVRRWRRRRARGFGPREGLCTGKEPLSPVTQLPPMSRSVARRRRGRRVAVGSIGFTLRHVDALHVRFGTASQRGGFQRSLRRDSRRSFQVRWSWRAFRVGAAGAVDSDAFNSSPARSPTCESSPPHTHPLRPTHPRPLFHLAVHYLAGGDLLAQLHGISRVGMSYRSSFSPRFLRMLTLCWRSLARVAAHVHGRTGGVLDVSVVHADELAVAGGAYENFDGEGAAAYGLCVSEGSVLGADVAVTAVGDEKIHRSCRAADVRGEPLCTAANCARCWLRRGLRLPGT